MQKVRDHIVRAAAVGLLVATPLLPIPAMAASKAPLGYQLMCLRTPQLCQGGGNSSVQADHVLLQTLQQINAQVNHAIRPVSDGGVDTWNADATSGDCEDYVLAKRRALLHAGLPASALRIAYVKTRNGEGHAILVVKTSGGDLVLDNLDGSVRPLSRSGYRIVSISGADPLNWS